MWWGVPLATLGTTVLFLEQLYYLSLCRVGSGEENSSSIIAGIAHHLHLPATLLVGWLKFKFGVS